MRSKAYWARKNLAQLHGETVLALVVTSLTGSGMETACFLDRSLQYG